MIMLSAFTSPFACSIIAGLVVGLLVSAFVLRLATHWVTQIRLPFTSAIRILAITWGINTPFVMASLFLLSCLRDTEDSDIYYLLYNVVLGVTFLGAIMINAAIAGVLIKTVELRPIGFVKGLHIHFVIVYVGLACSIALFMVWALMYWISKTRFSM